MRSTDDPDERVWLRWYAGDMPGCIRSEFGLTPFALRATLARMTARTAMLAGRRGITNVCAGCGAGTGAAVGMRAPTGRPLCALCALEAHEEDSTSLKGGSAP